MAAQRSSGYSAAVALAAALLLAGGGRTAAQEAVGDVEALLRQKGCHACHAAKETLLGPSYEAIAVMHAPRRDVMTDVLAEKIIAGGAGNWGVAPMPVNARVSIGEARVMAAWILDQAGP